MQSISAANGREADWKKRKRRLIIVGIFVVVVVVACNRRLVRYVRARRIQYWIDFCQISNFDDRPTPTRLDEVDFASLS
jgi:hypothetical protein